MNYQEKCLFNPNLNCPLHRSLRSMETTEVSGTLCMACTDMLVIKGAKAHLITQLLITYHDEDKAKEAYDRIRECVRDW